MERHDYTDPSVLTALVDPDLVVTDMVMRNGHGATLMRRLREQGSSARFLVMAARRTHQTRALAASAGALACLAKPADPRLFVDVMRGLAPSSVVVPTRSAAIQALPAQEPQTGEMFLSDLRHRLSTIAISVQSGDAAGVAVAADVLAVSADRLGHAEVAFVSYAIAREARRGVVTHGRLAMLLDLCARLDTEHGAAVQAATSR